MPVDEWSVAGSVPGGVPLRFRWNRAVQDSELKPTATLVAYAFGQFIGADRGNPADTVWLSLGELQRITRLSRDAVNRATRVLRTEGWLMPLTAAGHHRSVLYRAVLPGAQQYVSRTAEEYGTRTADDFSGTPADASGTAPGASGTAADTSGTAGGPYKERRRNEKERTRVGPAGPAPASFCPKHPQGSAGSPCGPCGVARESRAAWQHLTAVQAEPGADDRASYLRRVETEDDCPHGLPGGDLHRPWLDGYSPRCATCRLGGPSAVSEPTVFGVRSDPGNGIMSARHHSMADAGRRAGRAPSPTNPREDKVGGRGFAS